MEYLDFSENACIKRYCKFCNFDEGTEHVNHIDGIDCDEPLIEVLNTYGSLTVDISIYETRAHIETEQAMPQLKMAA